MLWLILSALAIGAIVVAGVVITATLLRNFRIRRNTKLLVVDMNKFIKNMPEKEKHSVSFEDLEKCSGKQVVSEFDPITEDIVQTKIYESGMDEQVKRVVDAHDGYIILGD